MASRGVKPFPHDAQNVLVNGRFAVGPEAMVLLIERTNERQTLTKQVLVE